MREGLVDTGHTVEAPEGVELGLRIASPIPRAVAWASDLGMRAFIYLSLANVLFLMGPVGQALGVLVFFALEWGWSIGFEVYGQGSTPGKRLVGLRVVRDDGTPVGWSESVLRNVTRTADFLPFGYALGFLSCLAGEDGKRLGDRAAGTLVVHRSAPDREGEIAEVPPVRPPVPLSLEEQGALIEFARRSPSWTPARRREVADHLVELSGASGEEGARRLIGMARWILGAA